MLETHIRFTPPPPPFGEGCKAFGGIAKFPEIICNILAVCKAGGESCIGFINSPFNLPNEHQTLRDHEK